ncbi:MULTISPECIES: MarR family transcriptional regulator [Sphingopyxis]|uniref:MarR family transcriptional regulator n=1 Tax=Sphingopyxis TaxID=165697 RepID=UPI0016447869|nr:MULTISPECIES: MarR family transcriptional regulator [Sphingopyxis]QXF12965.1 MarR family transcriptional regulator [Sphingopyxis terrae subsp. terrae]
MKAESPAAAVSSEPPSLETALHKMRRSPDDQADDSSDMILLVAARAEQEYANRRRRERALPGDLLGEPAWDMLLDLYVQKARARPVSVHSLCIAAMVPPTTALRWIDKLLACGLVERRRCERDLRVVHIELTGRGMTAIEAHFAGTQAS